METRICRISGKQFTISDQEKRMYEQWDIPLSDISPMERLRAASAYWNTFNLYWTKDARTGDSACSRILIHSTSRSFMMGRIG